MERKTVGKAADEPTEQQASSSSAQTQSVQEQSSRKKSRNIVETESPKRQRVAPTSPIPELVLNPAHLPLTVDISKIDAMSITPAKVSGGSSVSQVFSTAESGKSPRPISAHDSPPSEDSPSQVDSQQEEPHEKGQCFFLDDPINGWVDANFFFVRDHVLELYYTIKDGQFETKEVNHLLYKFNNGYIGESATKVERWQPDSYTPGACALDTVLMFQHERDDQPDLWLQFPSRLYLVKFYDYWQEHIRQDKSTPRDPLLKASVRAYRAIRRGVVVEK